MRLALASGRVRRVLSIALLIVALCTSCSSAPETPQDRALGVTSEALATNPPIVISQLYGGGGNGSATFTHDFVELLNRSTSTIALDQLSLQYASATGAGLFGASGQIALFPEGATLAPNHYYLVRLATSGMVGGALPSPDATPSPTINMAAASGKIALVLGTTSLGCNGSVGQPCSAAQAARIVDLVGYGTANYFETAAASAISGNATSHRRAGSGCTDTNNNSADFSTLNPPVPRNSGTTPAMCPSPGDFAPRVVSTVPVDDAASVDPATAVQIAFSEPVTTAGSWFTFSCTVSGTIVPAVSGGPTTFTLTPPSALAVGDACTINVIAANVTDNDATDPPNTLVLDYAFDFSVAAPAPALLVRAVQGSGHLSPYDGQLVNVGPAVVTAVKNNGFFMQDPNPDSDDATSEGIFVFTSSMPAVSVGHLVTVSGTVDEYRAGCPCSPSDSAYDNLTTTELTNPTVNVISTGNPLPAPIVLGTGAGERAVPLQVIEDDAGGDVETSGVFDVTADGIDFYESLEGMRVRVNSPAIIDPRRDFSGSQEIGVLVRSDAGLRTPRGGIILRETDFNPERLFLADALLGSFPEVQVGDAFNGAVIGVLDYSFANFKLLVSQALPAVTSGGLTREITSLVPANARQLTVASLNVENLDPLDPATKFQELADIVVENLGSPDLVALEEVQDNNGATNDAIVSASTTMTTFTNAIVTAGGPGYSYRQINPIDDQDGGEPGGNIRVAFMYRTDRGLAFVDRGAAGSTTANSVDTTGPAPQLSFSPGRIDPTDSAFNSSRKPLAGEFTFQGETFFVIANHFNSKGGDDPLFGRFQPPVLSSETQRTAQATIVAGFVDAILNDDPDAFVVVLGDLNDFGFSTPVEILEGADLFDLGDSLPANERYTYVYQGNSQDLDHIMVSPNLVPRATYDVVHVNAEFAVQASDHEPGIARIDLGTVPTLSMGSNPNPVIAGSALSFQVAATGSPAPAFSILSGPAGLIINPTTGLVTWNPTGGPGTYQFTVQASNYAGTTMRQYTLTVNAAGPAVPALPPLALGALVLGLLGCSRRVRLRRRDL